MINSIRTTKEVKRQGNSVVLIITEESKMLGVDRGDIVEVTIEKKEGMKVDHDEEPLTEEDMKWIMTDERYASH